MPAGKMSGSRQEMTRDEMRMRQTLGWIWKTGMLSTFLAGLFVLLPIVITVSIMAWAVGVLAAWIGGDSFVGRTLSQLGLHFVTDPTIASVLGWVSVLLGVWLLGAVLTSVGKKKIEMGFHSLMERIPLVNILYRPVAQAVHMLQRDSTDELPNMNVVYCGFGGAGGAGFLGLLVSDDVYQFNGQRCQIVYVPTSPVPMSGALVFAAVETIHCVDMPIEALMKIYLSIGVMSSNAIPEKYVIVREDSDPAQAPRDATYSRHSMGQTTSTAAIGH
jgi:uncharacterized membrane protein